jgi:hypothetical protein
MAKCWQGGVGREFQHKITVWSAVSAKGHTQWRCKVEDLLSPHEIAAITTMNELSATKRGIDAHEKSARERMRRLFVPSPYIFEDCPDPD